MSVQIDEAILATVGTSWKKVAMVIAKVAETPAINLPSDAKGLNVIAQHIEALVQNGILTASNSTGRYKKNGDTVKSEEHKN